MLTLCNPMHCSIPGFPILHYLLEFAQPHVHWVITMMPANHLILCCPLPLLPSIFPSIRVFSNKSVVRIRWPEYWSFSFSISPSNEYWVLISYQDSLVWSPLIFPLTMKAVMSLLFNMLSRFVTAVLSSIKCLLISWLQSPLQWFYVEGFF